MKIYDAYGRELILSASYSIDQFLETSPTNGETSKAPNSDWAYDHNAAATGVHGAAANTLMNTGNHLDDTAGGTDGETTKAPTSNAFYDFVQGSPRKNAIINGCFRVAQQGTSFTSATTPANSDDTYLLDNWILLSDGNDIVDVSRVVRTTPNGSYAECKLEVETANKQFGILTILEAKDSARYIGQTVSLSFKARMAAADDNTHSLKAVILSWSSTADSVTSDVVDAWGATPTYVANWTAENTPASQTLTTTEQTFTVEGVVIDTASTKNIAVFIFCDQTDGAIDDAVIITDVQLELGSVATPFEFRPIHQEIVLCSRYFYNPTSTDRLSKPIGFGMVRNDTFAICYLQYLTEMRTSPSAIVADDTGLSLKTAGGGAVTTTDIAPSGLSPIGCFIEVTVAAGAGAANNAIMLEVITANCLFLSARL